MALSDDEFAEFDTDPATFDAMLSSAEPAEIVHGPAVVTVRSAAAVVVSFPAGLPLSVGSTSVEGSHGTTTTPCAAAPLPRRSMEG